MDAVWEFLAMGGYAAFVWPAVGIVLLGLLLLLAQSIRALKSRERELAELGAAAERPAHGEPDPPIAAQAAAAKETDET